MHACMDSEAFVIAENSFNYTLKLWCSCMFNHTDQVNVKIEAPEVTPLSELVNISEIGKVVWWSTMGVHH